VADSANEPKPEPAVGTEAAVAGDLAVGDPAVGDPVADAQVADALGADDGNVGNLGSGGEPSTGDGRRTHVTATLSESDVLLQDADALLQDADALLPDAPAEEALAEEALAPDTIATSAFDAEEPRTPAVWDAPDFVTEIYHGHYNQLVRLGVLLVHDVQTAEEVVQDAFEAMHLAARRLRDTEKALQYVRQSVVNRSRSVLRHRKVVDMHAPKPAPDEPSAEHAALALLERSAVAAALHALPVRQREAIVLRYYADFSEADIAKAMGISKGAVKSHTARAMSSLKMILSQETA
jgi:RNA polymerase sigma-70 factor (sigma-E family)